MYCNNCGRELKENETVCPECGKNNKNKRSTKFFIKLFLGEFILFAFMIIISMVSIFSFFKTEIKGTDTNTFISTMEKNEYSMAKNDFKNPDIANYYTASKEYVIEFIEAVDNNSATNIFNQYVDKINSNRGREYLNVEQTKINDFQKYAITINNISYAVAKNGNTVIYATGSSKYKNIIDKEFEKLGYGFNIKIKSIIYVCLLPIIIILMITFWKIFKKADQKGWYALIPIYNMYILTKIALKKGIYFLLMFIPIVNYIFIMILWYKLAKAFGKDDGFAICNIFFSLITLQIIAFDDSKYIG